MLEFARKELKFKLDDTVYNLKYPNVKQINEYSKNHEKSDDKFETTLDFLVDLGLKKDVSENMEIDHLTAIIEALTATKK